MRTLQDKEHDHQRRHAEIETAAAAAHHQSDAYRKSQEICKQVRYFRRRPPGPRAMKNRPVGPNARCSGGGGGRDALEGGGGYPPPPPGRPAYAQPLSP